MEQEPQRTRPEDFLADEERLALEAMERIELVDPRYPEKGFKLREPPEETSGITWPD